MNDSLDRSFLAMAHPVRRAIVERLARGPATVGEAAAGVAVSKPAVTKHLKVLEDAGVVEREVQGRTHRLALRAAPLADASAWIERQRALWERKFDVVEDYLKENARMSQAATPTELRMERTFDAPKEAVFDAWTNPEVLRRWWAAGPDWETPLAEVDLRVGGRYRLTMRDPASGAEHTVVGEYTEVSRPDRLAYTWSWEEQPMDTLVAVEFRGAAGRTTVTLTHGGLPGDDSRAQHEHGWAACLDNLERALSAA